jgi:hypothetical protein
MPMDAPRGNAAHALHAVRHVALRRQLISPARQSGNTWRWTAPPVLITALPMPACNHVSPLPGRSLAAMSNLEHTRD